MPAILLEIFNGPAGKQLEKFFDIYHATAPDLNEYSAVSLFYTVPAKNQSHPSDGCSGWYYTPERWLRPLLYPIPQIGQIAFFVDVNDFSCNCLFHKNDCFGSFWLIVVFACLLHFCRNKGNVCSFEQHIPVYPAESQFAHVVDATFFQQSQWTYPRKGKLPSTGSWV